ncbi:hypothetical protein UlMin_010063 [Ulmus minor]
MANKVGTAQDDVQGNENSLNNLSKGREVSGESDLTMTGSKSKRLIKRVNPLPALIVGVKHSQIGKYIAKDFFFRSTRGLDSRIPKPVVSVDEKHLRRCLESIHLKASKSARSSISVDASSTKMGFFSESLSSEMGRGETFGSARLVFECPMVDGSGSVVINPAGQWILGTIMGSKSMVNILKSPLLQQYGAFDSNENFRRITSNNVNDPVCYDFMDSPSASSLSSSVKNSPIKGRHKYGSDTAHKRLVSVSSTNSASSDQTSSSASATVSQGMLQCTWKGGKPHFVFSIDEQKDVYIANLWKVEPKDDKALDYIYLFHSGKGDQKDHEICDSKSCLVGKMKVSNSFTLCPNNSKIVETEFVLFGGCENLTTDMHTSSQNFKKDKGLSQKVANVFRPSNSSRQRSFSKFGGSGPILENCAVESLQETGYNHDTVGVPTLFDDHPPANFELAAIVVKDHIPNTRKEESGGWGLKFLKKVGTKQTIKPIEASVMFDCCRNNGDCSTSMDILVPAGLHGGPRTRSGGPSSLTERWRSGGRCDCGGWDVGCPLTVLKPRSSKDEILPHIQGECKTFDFIIPGSEHGAPSVRIVNVQDSLYFVHFQRNLSILQTFSIAVAMIHTRSPTLRPKDVHEWK